MLQTPPAVDELEVSVFGPGIGESIVVHLGGGDWMVIDSCINPASKRAAALEYLEALGVDVSTRVVALVLTHWHDDHTAGAAEILRACSNARFTCSAALNAREFAMMVALSARLQLQAGSGSGLDEMRAIFDIIAERGGRRDGKLVAPYFAMARTTVFRRNAAPGVPDCVVEALSPSSMSLARGFQSLAPAVNSAKRKLANPGPNELSMALHVRVGISAALLGADLEIGGSNLIGWRGVSNDPSPPQPKAVIVKVPHHGSAGADYPPAWAALVASDANLAVTSFHSSKIPRPMDLSRLKSRSNDVFHTSPRQARAVKFDPATSRALSGVKIRERRGSLGHIRFRTAGGSVQSEVFGSAVPL